MKTEPSEDTLISYIQSDASVRKPMFRDYLRNLKAFVAADDSETAKEWARRAVSMDLDYSSHMLLRKILQRADTPKNDPLRIAVLGGPTTTQFVWFLDNFLQAQGIEAELFEGDYGLFRQSILMPDSRLDEFSPQLLFLATSSRDLPEIPSPTMPQEEFDRWVTEETLQWEHLWKTANERWGAQIIQNLFEIAPGGVFGHNTQRIGVSQERFIDRINRDWLDKAPEYVLFHDQQMPALEMGADKWFDPRFYLEAKMPCGPECLPTYAHSVASLILAAKGKTKKVLVLDLDNTLWGGVIGDDGLAGIRIGQGSAEGESYLAFQKYIKRLSQRGILLAVCSKNEMENAKEPFEKMPEMALGLSDFSCFVANWTNKAENLETIASELNLGLDSFVFVDDNPAERALVRRYLPQVAVPDMPEDPAEYIRALSRHRYFEPISLTQEDIQRAEYYRHNQQRRELAAAHTDINDFLKSLDMQARVEPIQPANMERSTQLINKSNQFNLMTRRYTLAEIKQMANAEEWLTLTLSLRDKMGDNGLISVLLARQEAQDLIIDTWVMSCRVLQRGVEYLALEMLDQAARERGCTRLVGSYSPTAKNHMVSNLYDTLGFELMDTSSENTTYWEKPIAADGTSPAHHIKVSVGSM